MEYLSTHHSVGEVVDLPSRFVPHALMNREVKPYKAKDIEVKSNKRTSPRTRKPSGAESKPKNH